MHAPITMAAKATPASNHVAVRTEAADAAEACCSASDAAAWVAATTSC